MQLYSDDNQYSHQVRFMLAIKSTKVSVETIDEDAADKGVMSQFAEANPQMSLPTLVERDMVLITPIVMLEYLEERLPFPALMPPTPAECADIKERLHYLYENLCKPAHDLMRSKKSAAVAKKSRQQLQDEISRLQLSFTQHQEWCLSSKFSLLDCCIAPLLWRLSAMDIQIPQTPQTKPLLHYMHKIFERDDFLGSMTQAERDMR